MVVYCNIKFYLIVDSSGTTAAAGVETQADLILADVGEALGNTAAAMTVLKARQNVAYSASANMLAAAARLEDTDFATSSANLAKYSILTNQLWQWWLRRTRHRVLYWLCYSINYYI